MNCFVEIMQYATCLYYIFVINNENVFITNIVSLSIYYKKWVYIYDYYYFLIYIFEYLNIKYVPQCKHNTVLKYLPKV